MHAQHARGFDQRRNTSAVRAPDPENGRQLRAMLAAARARGDEWILWIDNGCPTLTAEEYERAKRQRPQRSR